jgi:signal transduction histidine kinase
MNAIDRISSNPGTITLDVSLYPERRFVIITLSDSGPAIKPELAAEVYAPYEPHRDQLSTGLGMAIARRIVEQHNGDIRFENIPSGVRFTITLPL